MWRHTCRFGERMGARVLVQVGGIEEGQGVRWVDVSPTDASSARLSCMPVLSEEGRPIHCGSSSVWYGAYGAMYATIQAIRRPCLTESSNGASRTLGKALRWDTTGP